jgi:hypothetical protein
MGRNKKYCIKLNGLLRQIARHEKKIEDEGQSNNPDWDLIRDWKAEIRAWRIRVDRLKRRLP